MKALYLSALLLCLTSQPQVLAEEIVAHARSEPHTFHFSIEPSIDHDERICTGRGADCCRRQAKKTEATWSSTSVICLYACKDDSDSEEYVPEPKPASVRDETVCQLSGNKERHLSPGQTKVIFLHRLESSMGMSAVQEMLPDGSARLTFLTGDARPTLEHMTRWWGQPNNIENAYVFQIARRTEAGQSEGRFSLHVLLGKDGIAEKYACWERN